MNLWLSIAVGLSSAQTPPDTDLVSAPTIRQELLPALEARKLAARARRDDAARWFRGEVSLEEAFPTWSATRLGDRAFVESAIRTVIARGAARAAEPRAIAIEDAHRLFLRTVGGHAALRSIIAAMHATSELHFWVLGVHGPAWRYLNRIAARLKLDAFRDRVHLEPLEADALADWLEGRTGEAGYGVSYAPLTFGGPIGSDPTLAERRARTAFWRLLANASQGNPDVAQQLWLRSLDHAPGLLAGRCADGRRARHERPRGPVGRPPVRADRARGARRHHGRGPGRGVEHAHWGRPRLLSPSRGASEWWGIGPRPRPTA